MRVRVEVLGMSDLPDRRMVGLEEGTLAELKGWLASEAERELPEEGTLLAFINGLAPQQEWDAVELEDGDDVLFIVPASGG